MTDRQQTVRYEDLPEQQQQVVDDINAQLSSCSSPSACYDGKRHHWKTGWICEKCGVSRADHEEMKRHNKEIGGDQSAGLDG